MTTEPLRVHPTPFTRAVRDRVRLIDVVILAVVPAVLAAAFALPEPTRGSLTFDYAEPTALTAFTTAYVHYSVPHLLVNLGGYLLVVPVAYLLSVLSRNRQQFFTVFFTYVVVFPPLLAVFGLLFIPRGLGMGFSGVLMAFYGYLAIAVADHVAEHFDIGSTLNVAPLLFFSGLGLITVLGLWSRLATPTVLLGTAGIVAALFLIVVYYLLTIIDTEESMRPKLRRVWATPGYFELVVVALFVFVAVPFSMFPPDPISGTTVFNTFIHLLAYSLGFTAVYVTTLVRARFFESTG